MAINFKPINELPEIESVSAGDKLIVNSGGAAKQIDASKVGGSGGGSADIIYVDGSGFNLESQEFHAMAYADKDMTTPMTYAQGKAALLAGNAIMMTGSGEEGETYMCPLMVQAVDDAKIAVAICFLISSTFSLVFMFSDTSEGA